MQRHRFRDVGEWFATGVRPPKPFGAESLPALDCRLPSRLPVNESAEILNPQQERGVSPSVRLWKYRTDFILLAEMSAPDLSYGLRAGVKGRTFGGYLAFRSNFVKASADYTCRSDGTLENGSTIWPGGAEKTTSFNLSAGLLAQAAPWLTFILVPVMENAGFCGRISTADGLRSLTGRKRDGDGSRSNIQMESYGFLCRSLDYPFP